GQLCGPKVNPTGHVLSEGDLLTLYLAYLTDIAASELVERHKVSRYVRRRVTTPVFSDTQQQWVGEILPSHYREAMLVADHFSGRWSDGLDVGEALRVVRAARKRQDALKI